MEVEYALYLPENVIECLTMGTNSFIGLVDDTTVLKYPLIRSDKKAFAVLDLESRILQLIGPHKHIIGFKGLTDNGLLLERAPFGSIAVYLESNDPVLKQRLNWAYQATEALTAVHKMHILHRDISANNFLLDAGLNLKLSDFQGRVLAPNGDVVEDGLSIESTKSSMPRCDSDYADWRTDIFALGSAFYYIMEGHEPYPDLDPYRDEEQIVERFTSGQFPEIGCSSMSRVIHKCWTAEFDSAEAVLTRFHPIELDTQIYQFALSEKKDPFEPKGLPWTDFLVLAERVLALKDNIFDESWIEYLLAQHRLRSSFEMFQQGTGAAGAVKEA